MTDFLVWQEGWNTGIPDIDEQHIAMANMLNQIVDVISQSETGAKHEQALTDLLSEFLALTKVHFASEEEKMRQIAYPAYADHKSEHIILKGELAQYILEIKHHQAAINIGTLSSLKHWFIGHITGDDKAFASYYHNKRLTEKN